MVNFQQLSSFIIQPILLPMAAILFTYIFFYFAYGYFSVVVLHRLTKASFKLDIISMLDLFIAYFFSMMVVLVLYIHIPSSFVNGKFDPMTATFLGFVLLYLGRIITKNLGVFYGKVHYSAIFLTGGILILVRALLALGLPHEIPTVIGFVNNSINGIKFFIENYDYEMILSFFAAIILASFGEFILSVLPIKEKKLLTVMEKMPSGFFTYTGLHNRRITDIYPEVKGQHHGLLDKLEEILQPESESEFKLKSVKCAAKSLWLVEQIDGILSDQKCDLLVIKRPDKETVFKYIDDIFDQDPSLDILHDGREKNIESFIKKYNKRIQILKKYKTREYNLDDLAFLVAEYTNGNRCLLLIVLDTGPRMNRVGLFSEERYIVDVFSDLFDNAWKLGRDYDPNKSEILDILGKA